MNEKSFRLGYTDPNRATPTAGRCKSVAPVGDFEGPSKVFARERAGPTCLHPFGTAACLAYRMPRWLLLSMPQCGVEATV